MATPEELLRQALLCAAISLVVPVRSSAQPPPHVRDGDTATIARSIAAIERTLLPPVMIAGQPAAMSLGSRMEFYKVPGVSIAVINEGRVKWARAYGVKDVRTREPVTTEHFPGRLRSVRQSAKTQIIHGHATHC